ncbi:MAG: hypothetical protein PQ975_07260 [Methanobacterium sp.]|jgi:Tol biopolymer transport system component
MTRAYTDIFVYDQVLKTTERVGRVSIALNGGQAQKHLSTPSISADGRYVAFMASYFDKNLVAGDIFVFDRLSKTTEKVSIIQHWRQCEWYQ